MRTISTLFVFAVVFLFVVFVTEASHSKKKSSDKNHDKSKTAQKKSGTEDDKLTSNQKLLQTMLSQMPFVPMIPVAFLLGDDKTKTLIDKNMFTSTLSEMKKLTEKHHTTFKPEEKTKEPEKNSKSKSKKNTKKYAVQKSGRDDIPDDLSSKLDHDQTIEADVKDDDSNIDDDDNSEQMERTDDISDQEQSDTSPTDEPPIKTLNDRINKVKSETPYSSSGSLGNVCKNPCPMYCAPMCNSYCCASAIYRAYFGPSMAASNQNTVSQLPATIKQTYKSDINSPPQLGAVRGMQTSPLNPYQQRSTAPLPFQSPYLSRASYSPFYATSPTLAQNAQAQVKAIIAPASPVSQIPPSSASNDAAYLLQNRRRLRANIRPVGSTTAPGYPGLVEMYTGAQQKPLYCPSSCMKQCTQYCQPQCCGLMKRNQIIGKGKLMHLRDLLMKLRSTLSKKRNVLQNISDAATQGNTRSALLKLKDETSKAKDALTKQTELKDAVPSIIASLEKNSPMKSSADSKVIGQENH